MEIILLYSVSDKIKSHVYFSGPFCFSVTLTMLFDSVLSVTTCVGGCGCPIFARDVLMDIAFWNFANNSPNSASMADAMTLLIWYAKV